ncbi:MAG: hypothetical protein ABIJ21_05520 [Nanoarchaeota archaeon]
MRLSAVLQRVFDELKHIEKNMLTKKDLTQPLETISILGNPETMHQITQSNEDIQQGRTKEIHSAADLV